MTRLERKEAELEKLRGYRAAAIRRNDLVWLNHTDAKIKEVEKEIEECRKCARATLKDLLDSKDEDFKNRFYVGMLRISMLADAVTEACSEVETLFRKEFGVVDFSLLREVKEMDALSKKMARFMTVTGNDALTDCLVDNGKFLDCCIKLATKHITSKLKITTKI